MLSTLPLQPLLQASAFGHAVAALLLRADQQHQIASLEATHVDRGLIGEIDTRNHQIIFGRRGTGKTHLLRRYKAQLDATPGNIGLYLDLRQLTSSNQHLDPSYSLATRCSHIFRDLLNELHNALMEYLISAAPHDAALLLEELEEFGLVAEHGVHNEVPLRRSVSQSDEASAGGTREMSATPAGFELRSGKSGSRVVRDKEDTEFRTEVEDVIPFPAIRHTFSSILKRAGQTLILLLDEWSSLPLDVQPHFAEFIRRALLADPNVVVKIAAVEYRCRLTANSADGSIGIEPGADMAASNRLDEAFVYDINPGQVSTDMATLLFNHIIRQPHGQLLQKEYALWTEAQLLDRLFGLEAFVELVRSADGNPRDLINIFCKAVAQARLTQKTNLNVSDVQSAAWEWYRRDKARNESAEMSHVLGQILNACARDNASRFFLVAQPCTSSLILRQLLDARLVSLLWTDIFDDADFTCRYNLYTLDFALFRKYATRARPEAQTSSMHLPYAADQRVPRIVIGAEALMC